MDLINVLKNVDIIRLFKKNLFSAMKINEIEKNLGLSHHPTFRRLKILEKNNIIIKRKEGYAINMQDKVVFELMHFLENVEKIKQNER